MANPITCSPALELILTKALIPAKKALDKAQVNFCLIGSLAAWFQGGPEPTHDLDLAIPSSQLLAAAAALTSGGLAIEVLSAPWDDWLFKAWAKIGRDEVCLNIAYAPIGTTYEDLAANATVIKLDRHPFPVASLTDIFSMRLLAINERPSSVKRLDFRPLLALARALGPKVDWPAIAARTAASPYAAAFLTLVYELGIPSGATEEPENYYPIWQNQRLRALALQEPRDQLRRLYATSD